MMKSVRPDAAEITYLLENKLPGCPLCQGRPNVLALQNPETLIYRCLVQCSKCDCTVACNGLDREVARTTAVLKWSRRTPALPVSPASGISSRMLEVVRQRVRDSGFKKAEIAAEMGVTTSWVTQLLGKRNNMTLITLEAILLAVERLEHSGDSAPL